MDLILQNIIILTFHRRTHWLTDKDCLAIVSSDCFALKSQSEQLLHQLEICWSMWHQKHEDSVCVIINDEIKMHTVLLQPLSTEGHASLLDDVNESLACVERRIPESSHMVLYTPFHHDVAFPSTLLAIPQIRGILFHMVMTWTGMCFTHAVA